MTLPPCRNAGLTPIDAPVARSGTIMELSQPLSILSQNMTALAGLQPADLGAQRSLFSAANSICIGCRTGGVRSSSAGCGFQRNRAALVDQGESSDCKRQSARRLETSKPTHAGRYTDGGGESPCSAARVDRQALEIATNKPCRKPWKKPHSGCGIRFRTVLQAPTLLNDPARPESAACG
jgi:hypothetical protein